MTQLQGSMDVVNQSELRQLQQRVENMERRSGLMSPSFLTRAFSAWGYVIVAQFIVAIVLGGGFFVLSFCLTMLGIGANLD